ncbi:MAG: twin-arginine translocation signal domain-containing protein [Coriobacteriia bacterium]|nr:twin-arginine translocation signal domain-containing protein [Coriobacteriia bacterium]MCL2750418.1 twin-arginine translocation signal domain-containing protein [Coriobacteriia bacterium]
MRNQETAIDEKPLSRRGFLKLAGLGTVAAVGLSVAACKPEESPEEADLLHEPEESDNQPTWDSSTEYSTEIPTFVGQKFETAEGSGIADPFAAERAIYEYFEAIYGPLSIECVDIITVPGVSKTWVFQIDWIDVTFVLDLNTCIMSMP